MKRSVDEFGNEPKSKSQLKRDAQVFDDLAKELVALSEKQIEKMQMPDPIKTSVLACKTMQMQAMRRQLQYIGKILRKSDTSSITDELARIQNRSDEANAFFQRLESWRDRLISNDEDLLEQIIEDYPITDRQHIRQLIRNAQKEISQGKPTGASKTLFRYLRDITETSSEEHKKH